MNHIQKEIFNEIENAALRANRLGHEPATDSQRWKIACELERTAGDPDDWEMGNTPRAMLTKSRASHIISELAKEKDATPAARKARSEELAEWEKAVAERARVKKEFKNANKKAFGGLKKGDRVRFTKRGKEYVGEFDGKKSKGRIRIIYEEERTAEELNRLAGIDGIHYEAAVKKYGKNIKAREYISAGDDYEIL